MSIKNSNETIRNRTRVLPNFSYVPQPNAPSRVSVHQQIFKIISIGCFTQQSRNYNKCVEIVFQALYSYTKQRFRIYGNLRVPYNSFCILVCYNFPSPILVVTSHTLLFVPVLRCKHISRPVKMNAHGCVVLTKNISSCSNLQIRSFIPQAI